MPDALPPSAATPLRVAVASRKGVVIDQHFGTADDFLLFDLGASGPIALGQRLVADHAQGEEDKRETILRMLADCQVLLVAKIGPNPQEMLAKAGIEASDLYNGRPIEEALTELYAAKTAAAQPQPPLDARAFRLLHAMLRVSDMERSLDFYTRLLGMQVLEQREHKKNQFSQAYLGYGAGTGASAMQLELVFNWSREEPYVPGDAFGHIAIQVKGITALCDRLAAAGCLLPRPPRSQRHGDSIVAFVEDPDGYRIELIQPPAEESAAAVSDAVA